MAAASEMYFTNFVGLFSVLATVGKLVRRFMNLIPVFLAAHLAFWAGANLCLSSRNRAQTGDNDER
jgi:hypothetical protein